MVYELLKIILYLGKLGFKNAIFVKTYGIDKTMKWDIVVEFWDI